MRSYFRWTMMTATLVLAACMRPTIVQDPVLPPLMNGSAVVAAQPGVPGMPMPGQLPGQMPPMISPEMLQADMKAKAGTDTVQFGRDSYEIDGAAAGVLDRLAVWLLANPWARVSVEGHADVRQTREQALALGERRASAVRNFLLTRGVPPGQMDIVSWGRERPAVTGVHDATWLQNSRVRLVVVR